MNNSNGAAMLARIKPGDLVTVRTRDGGQATGRAHRDTESLGALLNPDRLEVRDARGFRRTITADNVVRVVPDTRTQTSAESDAVPSVRETFGK